MRRETPRKAQSSGGPFTTGLPPFDVHTGRSSAVTPFPTGVSRALPSEQALRRGDDRKPRGSASWRGSEGGSSTRIRHDDVRDAHGRGAVQFGILTLLTHPQKGPRERPGRLPKPPRNPLRRRGDARELLRSQEVHHLAAPLDRLGGGAAGPGVGDQRRAARRAARQRRSARPRDRRPSRRARAPRRDGPHPHLGGAVPQGAADPAPGCHLLLRGGQHRPDRDARRPAHPARRPGQRGAASGGLRPRAPRPAHPGLHPLPARPGHHRRQARLPLDPGSPARPGGPGVRRALDSLPRSEGHHRQPSLLPRALRRGPRQGARARHRAHREDGLRTHLHRHRPDLPAPARLPRPPTSSPPTCACSPIGARSKNPSASARSAPPPCPGSATRCAPNASAPWRAS